VAGNVHITSRDRGYTSLTKRIYGLGRVHLRVGITAKTGAVQKEDGVTGTTVVMVAEWQEFGTKTIPARSFIRAWFDENEPECKVLLASALRAVARGAISKQDAMDRLGAKFAGGMQARISNGIPPPLADSTDKRKGSRVPLIDTGQLRSSITWEVVL
jgi:hypothetical protein